MGLYDVRYLLVIFVMCFLYTHTYTYVPICTYTSYMGI